MSHISHPEENKVYACPECDSTDQLKKIRRVELSKSEHSHTCHACGHTFDTPTEREARSTSTEPENCGPSAKYEQILSNADASDLPL